MCHLVQPLQLQELTHFQDLSESKWKLGPNEIRDATVHWSSSWLHQVPVASDCKSQSSSQV